MEQEKPDVKGQANAGQFQNHPENINRAGGPPKTHWWSELLRERAELETEVKQADGRMAKLKNKEIMADALVEKAKAGDIAAIKEFGDRVQGKAPQSIGSIDDDGEFKEQNLLITFVKADATSNP